MLHIPQSPPPSLSHSRCLLRRGSKWKPKEVVGALRDPVLPLSTATSCCLHPACLLQPLRLSWLCPGRANHSTGSAPPTKCLQDLDSLHLSLLFSLLPAGVPGFWVVFFSRAEWKSLGLCLTPGWTSALLEKRKTWPLFDVNMPLLKLRGAGKFQWLLKHTTYPKSSD